MQDRTCALQPRTKPWRDMRTALNAIVTSTALQPLAASKHTPRYRLSPENLLRCHSIPCTVVTGLSSNVSLSLDSGFLREQIASLPQGTGICFKVSGCVGKYKRKLTKFM